MLLEMFGFRNWIVVALWLAGCGVAQASGDECKDLRTARVEAAAIGLPTTGAEVTSAREHKLGGMPYCKVLGRIHPVMADADDIRFELNLPEKWNGKALHYGGGTFDGYIITGRGRTAVGAKSEPVPLSRGYATFGSDSGHHKNYFPLPDVINTLNAKFARQPEQLRNFAGDQVKKVHDVAVALMVKRYGKAPSRMYFIGGSTGGREALRAVERFPDDYDGVLAAYAAWDLIELDLQFIRTAQALYAKGGFLGHAQTTLIQKTVDRACDGNDGVRDGIISDPTACHVEIESLRCKDGKPHHGCLSDAQMHTLETYATPQRTAFALPDGMTEIPGYNVLAGADLTGATGVLHFPLKNPVFLLQSFGYVIGDDVTRNFLSTSKEYNSRKFDVKSAGKWQDEVKQRAEEMDAAQFDLRPFAAHGGKLILVHGTGDTVIPTGSTVEFYRRVRAAMGDRITDASVRLYVIPGLGHGFGRFDAGFDTVGVLDAWADQGKAPAGVVVTDNHGDRRTRPLCEWPKWPRYTGGDPNRAESFVCAVTAPEDVAERTLAAQ